MDSFPMGDWQRFGGNHMHASEMPSRNLPAGVSVEGVLNMSQSYGAPAHRAMTHNPAGANISSISSNSPQLFEGFGHAQPNYQHDPACRGNFNPDFMIPLEVGGVRRLPHSDPNTAHVKRPRIAEPPSSRLSETLAAGSPLAPGTAHQDALMELARENILLKHHLYVATLEMSRLSTVLSGYEEIKDEEQEDEDSKHTQSRYWTEEEHQRFLEGVQNFGHKDVKAIAEVVGTRSATQVRTHAQKYFMKMARCKKQDDKTSNTNNSETNPVKQEGPPGDRSTFSTAAAAAAAAGEAGTSAAAAAAFVAASHSNHGPANKQHKGTHGQKPKPNPETITVKRAEPKRTPIIAVKKSHPPGSPSSMGSGNSRSDGTSNGTSSGNRGVTTSDATNGNGSTSGHSIPNGNGSCSDSGRCGQSSSNEGSDHGFFDAGEEEEDGLIEGVEFSPDGQQADFVFSATAQ